MSDEISFTPDVLSSFALEELIKISQQIDTSLKPLIQRIDELDQRVHRMGEEFHGEIASLHHSLSVVERDVASVRRSQTFGSPFAAYVPLVPPFPIIIERGPSGGKIREEYLYKR